MTPKEFRQLRLRLGYVSQDEIAKELGSSRSAIALAETKRVTKPMARAIKLLDENVILKQIIRLYEYEKEYEYEKDND